MNYPIIDIKCANCQSTRGEMESTDLASDHSFVNGYWHCYACGKTTILEYVPVHAEVL